LPWLFKVEYIGNLVTDRFFPQILDQSYDSQGCCIKAVTQDSLVEFGHGNSKHEAEQDQYQYQFDKGIASRIAGYFITLEQRKS
jgi:hypothetical protein